MNQHRESNNRLIMIGAGRRLALAALVVSVLWALFFWSTSTPGGL
jgi:hypothetical protein